MHLYHIKNEGNFHFAIMIMANHLKQNSRDYHIKKVGVCMRLKKNEYPKSHTMSVTHLSIVLNEIPKYLQMMRKNLGNGKFKNHVFRS